MTMGQRLKDARKARKLSQAALAKLAHIGQSTIADLERGRTTSCTATPQLAAVLGVAALWLAEGRGPREGLPPIKAVQADRKLNSKLMTEIYLAVGAYMERTDHRLDDVGRIQLTCRLYEQFADRPDATSSDILGYLASLAEVLMTSRRVA